MLRRRFLLRLAVAVVTFIIGLAAASLFGAARPWGLFARRHHHPRVVFVPFNAQPRDFGSELSPLPPCTDYRLRHAFERHERRDPNFYIDPQNPPPPPAPPAAPPPPARRFEP